MKDSFMQDEFQSDHGSNESDEVSEELIINNDADS